MAWGSNRPAVGHLQHITNLTFQHFMAAGAPGLHGGSAFQSLLHMLRCVQLMVRKSDAEAAPALVVEENAREKLLKVSGVSTRSLIMVMAYYAL